MPEATEQADLRASRRDGAAPVHFVSPSGLVDPSTLVVGSQRIAEPLLGDVIALARSAGRVIEHDGLCIYAFGEAGRLVFPRGFAEKEAGALALALLGSIGTDDRASVLALGALAFDAAAPAQLVVPEVSVVVRPGDAPSATAIAPSTDLHDLMGRFPFSEHAWPPLATEMPPDAFELASVRSHQHYRDAVTNAVEAIRAGSLQKVVLAREVSVIANRDFARRGLVSRLRQLHPSCTTFALDGFVGASPELLVRRVGHHAISRPLAGTIARSGDPDEDARLAAAFLVSEKERSEHAFVVDMIEDVFERCGARVTLPDGPHLLDLRNVVHLASEIEATFDQGAPGALELVALLHPTPAVGGSPRDAALEYLAHHEALDRDRYAGPVGWIDATGDGEFYLGIRSAIIEGNRARLFAGCGIVVGSLPDQELAETQLKLQALLAAAVRP